MDQLSDTYFYVTNIRGDVEAIVDEDGNEVASYSYDPWGVPTITGTLSLPNPFLYQGAYGNIWDEEIELYWMNARHYDPSISRFITQDRSHGTLTNTMSQNLYIYCYNSPITFSDPSGNAVDPGHGCGLTKADLTDEQKELYEWMEEEGIEVTIYKFLELWNEAEDVEDRMQKYNPSGEHDNNQYDLKIAFWTCYWNDKAKLGLEGKGLVSLANLMKGICYMETECGLLGHEHEGLLQVSTFGYMSELGYVSNDFFKKWNGKLGTDANAGIFAGIGHWMMDYSGYANDGKWGPNRSLEYLESLDSKVHTIDAWKGATNTFCGGCTMNQRAESIGLSYADLVFDLVQHGMDTHMWQDSNEQWHRSEGHLWTDKRGTGKYHWDADIYEEYILNYGRDLVEEGVMNDKNIWLP